jgi:hypothetical protein
MRHRTLLGLLIALPLTSQSACTPAIPEDFASFLPQFLASRELALSRMRTPLPVIRWDESMVAKSQAQTGKVVRKMGKHEMHPSLPLATYLRQQGLTHKIARQAPEDVTVQIFKPDTDWLLHYHFRLQRGCWQLWQIEDFSL